jgi:hypothetical protein
MHLLWCPYENEHTTTYNTLPNIIATIILKSVTHVQKEVSHLFPHHTRQRMNILIIKHGFWTLMDVMIVDSTRTNMVQRALMTTTHVTMMVAREKKRSYIKRPLFERTPGNDFIPLVIEMFGCLHFRFDSLFIILCKPQSTIFFNPLDVCFLLSTMHVHNPTMCASHNNFSTGYYIWLRFLIFCTHHS